MAHEVQNEQATIDLPAMIGPLPDGVMLVHRVRAPFRCCWCARMQPVGATMAMVPDGIRGTDPAWAVTAAARVSATASSWCLACCEVWRVKPVVESPLARTARLYPLSARAKLEAAAPEPVNWRTVVVVALAVMIGIAGLLITTVLQWR